MVMAAATMAENFHSPVKAGQGATVHTQGWGADPACWRIAAVSETSYFS